MREASARLETARAALRSSTPPPATSICKAKSSQPWRIRQEQQIEQLDEAKNPDGDGLAQAASMHRVELALIAAERARLNALLREGRISDEIRRRIERDLDLDEERLRRNVRGIVADD